ncbi:MAG TPA: hypothetical protein VK896_04740 [Gaiellaceae bacterium]|nr:hypothetical protein [Gaiellaceae bacterium]
MGNAGRIGIGVAALVVAVVLFIVLRPGDEDASPASDTTAAETTAPATTEETETEAGESGETETEAEETTTEEGPAQFRVDVPASGPQGVQRLNARQGDEVELVVTLGYHDDVHLHGYDLLIHTGPGLPPARFEFEATTPGRFEIETETAHQLIAELRVRP